ncbi:hypothetical protein HG531_006021 [Fusarium graminearum]|nr:hypothetical protein HG531_006021 [Fusarium graminearum]
MGGANHANTCILELRTTGTTEDLQHIQDTQVDKLTILGAINLSSLDNNCCSGQVDTPGKGGGTTEDLQDTLSKKSFHKVPVRSRHTSVMNTDSLGQQLSNLLGLGLFDIARRLFKSRMISGIK